MKSSTVITGAAKLDNYTTIKSFDSRLSFAGPHPSHIGLPPAWQMPLRGQRIKNTLSPFLLEIRSWKQS